MKGIRSSDTIRNTKGGFLEFVLIRPDPMRCPQLCVLNRRFPKPFPSRDLRTLLDKRLEDGNRWHHITWNPISRPHISLPVSLPVASCRIRDQMRSGQPHEIHFAQSLRLIDLNTFPSFEIFPCLSDLCSWLIPNRELDESLPECAWHEYRFLNISRSMLDLV